jgi:Protein of unknown function (DUF3313)
MKQHIARACAVTILASLFATAALAADATLTDDGLQPIKVKNIDKAYKRPGASLAGYTSVIIRPVSVEFSKTWNPRDYGGPFGLKTADVEKIRNGLAKLANNTFSKTLTKGGYPVVSATGEHVLDVEAHIVDLFVNAPEVQTAVPTRTYVFSAGEMRLVVTLRDSVTGTILYRTIDKKRGTDDRQLVWANDVFNQAEAELALTGWARQLKDALDSARAN